MQVNAKKDCPHIESSKLISLEEFNKISFGDLKCKNCDEKEELWICLICGETFCSRYINSHFIEHNKTNPEHCLCFGIMDTGIWCYECINNQDDNKENDGNKKGSFITSEKTDEYIKAFSKYKFPKNENEEEEDDNYGKENITYAEKYVQEIVEKNSEEDLCDHIKNLTKEDFAKSPVIKGLTLYTKKVDIIFGIICFSCNKIFHNYAKLNSHKNEQNHNIYFDLNEVAIVCLECKQKHNLIFVKDKLSIEQKAAIESIIEKYPICPKFLTKEEIFEIKYNKLVNNFINGKYKNIIFMVGAGISTSAGIPDFRSESGLFKQLQDKYNLSGPEEFFQKSTFLKNPQLFYDFTKLFDLSQTKPTIAHKFMNFMTQKKYVKYVFTQNIDGLEIKAKIPNKKLIFAHGNFHEGHCAKCYKYIDIKKINEGINKGEVYYCPKCKGPCKPKIVFYGENLPKLFYDCLNDIKDIDLIIIMGTSLKVYPFAAIPDYAPDNVDITVFNMEKVGAYQYDKISNGDIFIKGKTDENILKFLKDIKLYEDFEKFIKDEYGEELKDIIGNDIKLMNVKDLGKNNNKVDKLTEEMNKLNLNEKKEDDDDGDLK